MERRVRSYKTAQPFAFMGRQRGGFGTFRGMRDDLSSSEGSSFQQAFLKSSRMGAVLVVQQPIEASTLQ